MVILAAISNPIKSPSTEKPLTICASCVRSGCNPRSLLRGEASGRCSAWGLSHGDGWCHD
ncbi:hypothetical protein BJX70DRAFT_364255 [Aspergillus crustosus]